MVSVHNTILSAPLKHVSLTKAVPSLSVALPLHGAPEVIEKPPIGPHELIVVERHGRLRRHLQTSGSPSIPQVPAAADRRPENVPILGTIPRIRPPPSTCMKRFDRLGQLIRPIVSARGNRVALHGRRVLPEGKIRDRKVVERLCAGTGPHGSQQPASQPLEYAIQKLSVRTVCTIAGPMMMSSIAGKIISTSGKRILMVVFWADSSA